MRAGFSVGGRHGRPVLGQSVGVQSFVEQEKANMNANSTVWVVMKKGIEEGVVERSIEAKDGICHEIRMDDGRLVSVNARDAHNDMASAYDRHRWLYGPSGAQSSDDGF